MPVFLAYVRGHDALAIGETMLVTGAAQLIAAPLVVWLERHVSARLLTCFGFLMFAAGLALSAFETPRSDYDEMFWPQVVRGVAIMLCLLPPIRLALGHLPVERVPDASGLFNLMRNLGGAIGLALIDTVIFGRAEMHGRDLAAKLASWRRGGIRLRRASEPADGHANPAREDCSSFFAPSNGQH